MALKRTELLGYTINHWYQYRWYLDGWCYTTAGGVGIASTTYLRGVIMHNTGLGLVHHHFTFIQLEPQHL
jgi:hypothetical protein